MTFRLLNALSEFFKAHPTKEICLRSYDDNEWHTLYSFDIDGDIENVGNKIFVENEGEGFVVHYIDGTLKHFDKWGMPVKIEDRFSSSIEFEYYSSINNNVRRVHSILKNDIPVVDIEWKDNRISKISDLRKSISVSYSYNGNGSLVSFVDADGDVYGYTYDSGSDLVKMLKPDGTFIKIEYSVNGSDMKKRVSAVTNEEGFEERFSIDEQNGKTIFTDADGNQYVYNFSDDEILHEEVSEGYSVNRTYDERGLVETLSDGTKQRVTEETFCIVNNGYTTEDFIKLAIDWCGKYEQEAVLVTSPHQDKTRNYALNIVGTYYTASGNVDMEFDHANIGDVEEYFTNICGKDFVLSSTQIFATDLMPFATVNGRRMASIRFARKYPELR